MKSFKEFWPFYLSQHRNLHCRRFHFIGTLLGISGFIFSLESGQWKFCLLGIALGYAFAWMGHFFIEKNRPATFKYPLWSFLADLKMFLLMASHQLSIPEKSITDNSKPS